jgi:hypothetical protein
VLILEEAVVLVYGNTMGVLVVQTAHQQLVVQE